MSSANDVLQHVGESAQKVAGTAADVVGDVGRTARSGAQGLGRELSVQAGSVLHDAAERSRQAAAEGRARALSSAIDAGLAASQRGQDALAGSSRRAERASRRASRWADAQRPRPSRRGRRLALVALVLGLGGAVAFAVLRQRNAASSFTPTPSSSNGHQAPSTPTSAAEEGSGSEKTSASTADTASSDDTPSAKGSERATGTTEAKAKAQRSDDG